MTFKISFFKKALILSDFKRYWWVSALYTLALMAIIPFKHLMETMEIDIQETQWIQDRIDRTLSLSQDEVQVILICVVPVVMAVLIFRYLQVDKSSVMMHSLPFKRSSHYVSHCFSGLVLLLIPAVLNCLIMIMLNNLTVLGSFYTLPKIFMWLGFTTFFNVLLYSIAVFVGMFTGSSVAQIAFTYIVHILPVGIYTLLKFSLAQLLYGFGEVPYSLFNDINYPLFMLFNGTPLRDVYTVGYFMTYIMATVLFLVLGWFVYKYRKLETAGDIIAFPVLYPVFKYGLTFSLMLVGGAYFCGFSRQSFPLLIIGYILGSVLGYFVAEILIHKSLKVLRFYKGYLCYSAVVLILFGGISLDVFGFVNRVPKPEEVNKVYFGYNFEEWVYCEKQNNHEYLESRYGKNYFENNKPLLLENKENIAGITELQRHLIKERKTGEGPSRYIIYSLKNGGYIIRQYKINETDQNDAALLKPIYESVEYKKLRFPTISLRPDDIKLITLNDHRIGKNPLILTEDTEIQEVTELLKNEIIKMSYEDIVSGTDQYISISVIDNKDKETRILIQRSFISLIKLLKDKGYYDRFALLLDDIVSVELEKEERTSNSNQAVIPKRVKIYEREVIEELVNVDPIKDYNSNTVLVRFNIRNSSWQRHVNIDTAVSARLKGYFEELANN
ncbi:DUF6449 domain-containing protein [Desulfosporosinus nitroreducens]|uniref:MFS transporter n=1 Tax=Desulfosporosinus nitroreducens TaxID=2018668 RepID=A0ABT8QYY5_9FIRM|nr:DUF6449 domain-containing protein [Desulfosporosinus nitroreducens]MDO0825273.1 MFS transporter [Desulfosporosinus nitroreducens]